MKILIDTLGVERAKYFLEQSVSLIRQNYQTLQENLSNSDWEQASLLAHRIKGTANLYGHAGLIECLDAIINKNINNISTQAFRERLEAEQQQTESCIHAFLSKQG